MNWILIIFEEPKSGIGCGGLILIGLLLFFYNKCSSTDSSVYDGNAITVESTSYQQTAPISTYGTENSNTGKRSTPQQNYFNSTQQLWNDGAGYWHVFHPNGIYEGYLYDGTKNDTGTYTILEGTETITLYMNGQELLSDRNRIVVQHGWGTQKTFAFIIRNGNLELMWDANDYTPNVFTPRN